MNPVTPYEILIAQKLENLTVPDMADSIWGAIEQQLDAGSSPDGASSQTPPVNGLPGIGKGFYFFIAAVIGITMVWIYTGNKNDAAKNIMQPGTFHTPETPKPVTDSNQLNEMPGGKNNILVQPGIDKKDSVNTNNAIKNGYGDIDIDSITYTAFKNSKDDSVSAGINNIVKPFFDSSTSAPPVKKPKGVKGLRDSDYKIKISKNDSLKKGE